MANEFIARKGLIVLTNGATITGSLNTQGNINASGYTVTASAYSGAFTGSLFGTASQAITASFALTTAGTVNNANTASFVEYANVANKPALVSSSTQFNSLTAPFTGSFTGSLVGSLTGTSSFANFAASATTTNALTLGAGLTGGTFNGSAAVTTTVDTSSAHFLDGVKKELNTEGVISSSTQFTSLTAPFTGSFTGSFKGNLTGTSSYATNAGVANTVTTNTVSYTAGAGLSGGGTATLGGSSVTIDVVAGAGISLTGPTNDAVNIDTASAHFTGGVKSKLNTDGVISSSTQFTSLTAPFTGSFTGSFKGDGTGLTGVTATSVDYANVTNKPALVSSSTQFNSLTAPFTGSFTGSFRGNLIGTGSWANTASVALTASVVTTNTVSYTAGAGLSGGGTATLGGASVTIDAVAGAGISLTAPTNDAINIDTGSAHFTGGVKSKMNADGVISGSSASSPSQGTVRLTFNGVNTDVDTGLQTGDSPTFAGVTSTGIVGISNTTNSTLFNNGALIVSGGVGIHKDVNISGSLTVLGLLTATSMSTQYVTSSQLIVADNKIVVSVEDTLRFGGLSVRDSGSTTATASIYWDSLNHKFIYENISGEPYNSAMFIGGPVNTGTLGNEIGLTVGRIPVASGTDHIDSRPESSSIRVDFPSRLTHIEAGLVVTGALTASLGFTGSFTGAFTGTGSWALSASRAVTASYVLPSGLPAGTISSSTQFNSLTAPFTGSFTGSFVGSFPYSGLTGTPALISSSTQFNSLTAPFTGSFTGSFAGDGSNLTGIATTLRASGSAGGNASVSLQTQALLFSGSNGVVVNGGGQSILISGSDATTVSKGVASFNSTNFTVTNGAVSSNNITINGTNVTLGGTRNITLAEITSQGSSTSNLVTLNGGLIIQNSLYTTGSNPDVDTGTEIVATISTASYSAAFFDYYISSASNYRAGTVTSVWQPGSANIEFTDVSTNDIGNTSGLVMSVDLLNDLARLKATVSTDNWVVKALVRAL